MSKFVYDPARKLFADGDLDLLNDTIAWVLVKSTYVPNQATHNFLDDIAGGDILATSPALGGKTTDAGVFDAADPTVTGVPAAETVHALVLIKDTGAAATSPLILYTDEATNLPLATNGGNVLLTHSNGADRIFKL